MKDLNGLRCYETLTEARQSGSWPDSDFWGDGKHPCAGNWFTESRWTSGQCVVFAVALCKLLGEPWTPAVLGEEIDEETLEWEGLEWYDNWDHVVAYNPETGDMLDVEGSVHRQDEILDEGYDLIQTLCGLEGDYMWPQVYDRKTKAKAREVVREHAV